MSDLLEKCEILVAKEFWILDVLEDFKKKKNSIIEEVQNKIRISSDNGLMKVEAKLTDMLTVWSCHQKQKFPDLQKA